MGMKISNRVKWYFVVAVGLLFGLFVMLPDLCCDDDRDMQVLLRQSNLRSVAGAFIGYANIHDGLVLEPKDFTLIDFSSVYPDPIFGDHNQDDIWMCPIPWEDHRIPDDLTPYQLGKIPILHSKVDLNPDGASVAFWDGSARLLSNEEFEALIDVEDSICVGCQFAVPSWMYGDPP